MDWSVVAIWLIGRCTTYIQDIGMLICSTSGLKEMTCIFMTSFLRCRSLKKALNLFNLLFHWIQETLGNFSPNWSCVSSFIMILPRHILSRAFIAGWKFRQMVVIVPDSPPSSRKMLSRTTSLQQKHCVDCCPWKGTLLRGKQSSNHHFSEASC